MPRINLLPVRALARLDRAKHELVLAGLFNLVLLCALAAAYQLQAGVVASLHDQEAQAAHQLTQLADQVQRTKALDERTGKLSTKLSAIDRLRGKKSGPAQLLALFSEVLGELPRVWLTKLHQQGESVTLEGGAMTQGDISAFQLALGGRRPALREVTLALVSTAHDEAVNYLQWTITCRLPTLPEAAK